MARYITESIGSGDPMPSINQAFREIVCKIVYYGPGSGGKTTNLQVVHGNIPTAYRGELVSLATEQDRTLFFDYLPLDIGDVKGYKTKFQLYTVPGQVFYNATRKLVLRNVDGIVFVADSQASRFQDTLDSFRNLQENLKELGFDPSDIPLVLQYNKRDLPDAVATSQLEDALNPVGKYKSFESVATEGPGVRETLREISAQILARLKAKTNIVSDEMIVGERLGVAGKEESEAGASAKPSASQRGSSIHVGPPLEINQRSKVYWLGATVGSGVLDLSSMQNDRGETEYSLASNHRIFLFRRHFVRNLKYVGEDRIVDSDGVEMVFHLLRDTASGEGAPVTAYVERGEDPAIYLVYAGLGGEVKMGPEGVIMPV
jgi:hypothetical protein